jgi:hypothetical protein
LQEKKKEMIKNVIDHDVDMEEYMVSSMSQEEIESLFE